ncbi:hypothetical protein E2C01_077225 [Portunus trituberculatus]|uniref:Uncharacterized protein n=1 Tax=Portunus trituberculatus TaxID=210409 RepID=A0A5B7IFA4_PORTR|nr:hypothetical protein [Portunus trituberculatus]
MPWLQKQRRLAFVVGVLFAWRIVFWSHVDLQVTDHHSTSTTSTTQQKGVGLDGSSVDCFQL